MRPSGPGTTVPALPFAVRDILWGVLSSFWRASDGWGGPRTARTKHDGGDCNPLRRLPLRLAGLRPVLRFSSPSTGQV
jgi:hypothetical protein